MKTWIDNSLQLRRQMVANIAAEKNIEASAIEKDWWVTMTLKALFLEHKDKTAQQILGGIDAMKVKSSMTLFEAIAPNDIYADVLNTFFAGVRCKRTLEYLQKINTTI